MVSGDDNTACGGPAQQSLRRTSAINCPNNKLGGKVKEGIFSGLVTDKTFPSKPESERTGTDGGGGRMEGIMPPSFRGTSR